MIAFNAASIRWTGLALLLTSRIVCADAAIETTPPLSAGSERSMTAAAPGVVQSAIHVDAHKSTIVHLTEPAARISTGDAAIADILLIHPSEVYVLGKKIGTTNLVAWSKNGGAVTYDIDVGLDTTELESRLRDVLPGGDHIRVTTLGEGLILSGTVSDAYKADRAMLLSESFAGNRRVVNLLNTSAPQQVLLEVKIAEISKTLVDRLGAEYSINHPGTTTGLGWQLAGGYLTEVPGLAQLIKPGLTTSSFSVDATKKDEIVKVLAEPNIMAISGQEGSFLAGGKIYIPVPQGTAGALSITLEEKEYGIGLRFTPTVLEDGRINLKVSPEVSDINQQGVVITALGAGQSVLPSITTRRASTTVQLRDGQTFAIGGLIKNNVTETISRFPGLGDLPVLGALFRSSSFQNDKTELLFVVTAHLVKPSGPGYSLPTDGFVPPDRAEFLLGGSLEGKASPEKPMPESEPTNPQH
jgi:pilus assembly protein CpaC